MRTLPIESLDDSVHLWWFSYDASSGDVLDADELVRARQFRAHADRRWFSTRRGVLREILARYVSCPPMNVLIDRRCSRCGHPDHGRPQLVGDVDISFSTSSRPGCGVVAVARGNNRVGVDVEVLDDDAAAAVRRVALHENEAASPDVESTHDVLRLWCRKEALLKSIGVGVGGVEGLDVDVRDRFVAGHHLRDVWAPDGRVGAIATVDDLDQIVARAWPGDAPLPFDPPEP